MWKGALAITEARGGCSSRHASIRQESVCQEKKTPLIAVGTVSSAGRMIGNNTSWKTVVSKCNSKCCSPIPLQSASYETSLTRSIQTWWFVIVETSTESTIDFQLSATTRHGRQQKLPIGAAICPLASAAHVTRSRRRMNFAKKATAHGQNVRAPIRRI